MSGSITDISRKQPIGYVNHLRCSVKIYPENQDYSNIPKIEIPTEIIGDPDDMEPPKVKTTTNTFQVPELSSFADKAQKTYSTKGFCLFVPKK